MIIVTRALVGACLILLAASCYAIDCKVKSHKKSRAVIACKRLNLVGAAKMRTACRYYRGFSIQQIASGLPKDFWRNRSHQARFRNVLKQPLSLSACRFQQSDKATLIFASADYL